MIVRSGTSALALAISLAAVPAAAQQRITVASGQTDTTQKTVSGTDSVTVAAGGALTTSTSTAITWNNASTGLVITNSGTISTTASGGRAINASGSNNVRTITLTNNAGATITSQDDAFRINVNPTGGTMVVNNYGTIATTNGGQAIDFDAASSGAATILINNYATGVLRSYGQDAVRPGQGAVVTNAGLIYSDGATGNSYDGIDWQANSGTVINSGTISGLRHGITSDTAVNVTNSGTIIGRNGSGVGSDGTGTVANLAGGIITGQWDGVAANGDGDGVDIDYIATITNAGTIQGLSAASVDSGGSPNSAEGIAIGGGTVTNTTTGVIYGAGSGILVDDGSGNGAYGATTVTNAGTIRAGTGAAIQLVGTYNDTITNSGTIIGGSGGVAIDMGAGNDTLNLLTGSSITGTVNGGAGTDTINLGGTGSGSFAGATNFELLNVTSGSWTLTAASTYANGITIASGASLTGTSATLTGAIADAGTLTVNQTSAGKLTATLSGSGTLVKSGSAALTIGDQTGFTGAINVLAGQLILAGTLRSAVAVQAGATLQGNGTIAALTAASGSIVAPGNSIGTITVTGNYSAAAGSTYLAETSAAGTSDLIAVGGTATIASGATLQLVRDGGSYVPGTTYTLLTAVGGVSGTYTLVQTASGGTEFRLVSASNAVRVVVARTAASLAGVGATANQLAVAGAVSALGTANAAYAQLTLLPSDLAVRSGFDALSGEIHASSRVAMVKDAEAVQGAVDVRMLAPETGSGLWAQAIGRIGHDDGADGAADTHRNTLGGIGGIDIPLAGGRVGIAGGYTRTNLELDTRASFAKIASTHVIGYAGGTLGPVALRSGVGYAWVDLDTRRTPAFTGFADLDRAHYDGSVFHSFAEAGVPIPAAGGGSFEPFLGFEAYRVHTDGFRESGGAAALAGQEWTEHYAFASAGLRGTTPIVEGLQARARLAWQHGFDNMVPAARLNFVSGTVPFTVRGASLSKDAANLALDLAWQPVERLTVTSGFAGSIGGSGDDGVFRVGLSFGF